MKRAAPFIFSSPSGSESKSLQYGILKMIFVVIGTLISSVPFSYLSSFVMKKTIFLKLA